MPKTPKSHTSKSSATHRSAGWSLVAMTSVALLYAAVLATVPEQVAAWVGTTTTGLVAGYVVYASLTGLVGLIVGLRLIRRATPVAGRRAAARGETTLVPIAPAPAKASTTAAAEAPTGAQPSEGPAYWPPDQAVGVGWARASDALRSSDPTGHSSGPT